MWLYCRCTLCPQCVHIGNQGSYLHVNKTLCWPLRVHRGRGVHEIIRASFEEWSMKETCELDPRWGELEGGKERLLLSNFQGKLLIINVCSDINQYPSLPPTTCWDLEQAIVLTWSSMYCPIALMWLYPTSPYVILWHLPSSTRIHFILQTPSTCFVRKFPLVNYTNYQTGMVSLFLWSFPVLCLQR